MRKTKITLEEGWLTLFLLLALILTAAITIQQAELTAGMQVLPVVAGTAVIFGLLLAKSRFSPRTAGRRDPVHAPADEGRTGASCSRYRGRG